MRLYTSYFAKQRRTHSSRLVSIARREPPAAHVRLRVIQFAPSDVLLKDYKSGKVDEAGYKRRFARQLTQLAAMPNAIPGIEALLRDDDILCCWEGPGKFCHRHMVAEFLRGMGHQVTEL